MILKTRIEPHQLCERIAKEAHEGQMRNDGKGTPYVTHPIRVSHCFNLSEMRSVALLHDVLEDTDTSSHDLCRMGVPDEIGKVVNLLTKQYSVTSYPQYIRTVSTSPAATLIKLADMIDNLCDSPTEKQKTKYREADQVLFKALERELSDA